MNKSKTLIFAYIVIEVCTLLKAPHGSHPITPCQSVHLHGIPFNVKSHFYIGC